MIEKLITECTDYDYKEILEVKKPKSWLKSVSAFANGNGGSLFFGVNDSGDPVGLSNIKECSGKISELIKERIEPIPLFSLNPYTDNGKDILELRIQPGSTTPYYYHADGVMMAFIRSGCQSIETPSHVLNELVLKGSGQTYDSIISNIRLENSSFSILKSKYFNKTQLQLEDLDLVSFGLVKNGYLTRAGLLLSDENNILQSRIFCTRWNGVDKVGEKEVIDDDEISGSIIKQLDGAFVFYKKHTQKMWHKDGDGTKEEPEYDDNAILEALVNAIIHRDYNITGAEVSLNIYDNRIEIVSPGMMFSGKIIPEIVNFSMESMRRNPIVADVFNRIKLMNRRGSGLSNITNRTNELFKDDNNHVSYKTEHGFFTVKIENALYKTINEGKKTVDKVLGNVGELTLNELNVYKTIKEDLKITYDTLSNKTGISRRTIARVISSLEEKGFIARKESKSDDWTVLR